MSLKPPGVRLNQAILLLAGALFLVLVVAPQPGRFYWTPLTIGLAYLGAAIAGGREGGHWATACALTGWGVAVVLAGAARPDLDVAGLYLVGTGLGAVAGVLLQRAGFPVSAMGLAVVITGAGLALALTTQAPGLLDDARTYAVAMGIVALVNVVLAAMPQLQRAPASARLSARTASWNGTSHMTERAPDASLIGTPAPSKGRD